MSSASGAMGDDMLEPTMRSAIAEGWPSNPRDVRMMEVDSMDAIQEDVFENVHDWEPDFLNERFIEGVW